MAIGEAPLKAAVVLQLGPVPVTQPVVATWAIMALLVLVSWLGMRRASATDGNGGGSGLQRALEVLVEAMQGQLAEILPQGGWRYLPVVGTLFLYVVSANLSAILPEVKPPTASLETTAALALVVFFSVHAYGLAARGPWGYLRRYVTPSPFLLPLNMLADVTCTFSLMVRLFGNMMSHEFVIAIVVFLAGFLVPVPFLLLGVLIGVIQAYIFAMLSAVYIGAAVEGEGGPPPPAAMGKQGTEAGYDDGHKP